MQYRSTADESLHDLVGRRMRACTKSLLMNFVAAARAFVRVVFFDPIILGTVIALNQYRYRNCRLSALPNAKI